VAGWIKCGSHAGKNEQGDVVPVRGSGSQPKLVRGREAGARWRLTTEVCARGLVIWPQNHRWTVSLGLGLKTKAEDSTRRDWAAGLRWPARGGLTAPQGRFNRPPWAGPRTASRSFDPEDTRRDCKACVGGKLACSGRCPSRKNLREKCQICPWGVCIT